MLTDDRRPLFRSPPLPGGSAGGSAECAGAPRGEPPVPPSTACTREVVSLTPDHALRGWIARALPPVVRATWSASPEACLAAIVTRMPCLVIIDIEDSLRRGTGALISHIRERHPHVTVMVVRVTSVGASKDACAAIQAGAHELVLHGLDDLGATIARALSQSGNGVFLQVMLRFVALFHDEEVRRFLAHCAHEAHTALSVETGARAIGVSRRTLARHLRNARLPGGQVLAGWSRLLYTCYLLEDTGVTVASAAYQASWETPSALRNMFRRYLGLPSRAVRARGGFGLALEKYRDTLAAAARARPAHGSRSA